jgi:hypothetical protein
MKEKWMENKKIIPETPRKRQIKNFNEKFAESGREKSARS